ncbi:MAG: hypothetical protein FWC16_01245 [Defluviitaleaceae bacterium]|nr:hypothetical protein [Defluviitaleaceae bacterium]MCL2273529.1 hypothetical protein [Defluviitaleaceae bacterium]
MKISVFTKAITFVLIGVLALSPTKVIAGSLPVDNLINKNEHVYLYDYVIDVEPFGGLIAGTLLAAAKKMLGVSVVTVVNTHLFRHGNRAVAFRHVSGVSYKAHIYLYNATQNTFVPSGNAPWNWSIDPTHNAPFMICIDAQ